MSKGYQITSKKDSRQIAEFLAANAQAVLPMVESARRVYDGDRRSGRDAGARND